MRILEELYCGGVNLHETARKPSALREKLREIVTTNDQRMLAILTDVQKEQFQKCRETAEELSDLVEREAFSNGFCLAVKIMAEVMGTMEIPSVDE